MTTQRNIGVYILFKADHSQAKGAAVEVKGAVEGVTTATRASAEATARDTAVVERNTAARRRDAQAAREQAEAERQARDAAISAASSRSISATPHGIRNFGGDGATSAALADVTAQSDAMAAQLRKAVAAVAETGNAMQGLRPRTAGVVSDFLDAARAGAGWRAELNAIREQMNPAVAAHRQLRAAIDDVETAEAMGAITTREASVAIDQLSRSLTELDARSRAVGISLTQIGPPARLVTSEIQQLIDRQTGVTTASERSIAAHLRHGQALDDIRARYNPLFAVSRQYEQQLRDIDEAERINAISALEASAARERAAQAMAPMNNGLAQFGENSRAAGAHAANLSFQINDIFMMTAVGQSPWMLMMQQGPQVVQIMGQMRMQGLSLGSALRGALGMVLNPAGLATMAMIGIGAAGAQALMKLKGETKSFDDHLQDLNTTLGRTKANFDLIGNNRLGETFGNMTADVRALAQALTSLDQGMELKSLESVADGFLKKETAPSFLQWFSMAGQSELAHWSAPTTVDPVTQRRAANYADLGAKNTYEDFTSRTAELKQLAEAGDREGYVRQIEALQAAMSDGGSFTGMKAEAQKLLRELMQVGIQIAENNAAWNGTARSQAIARQIGDMTRGYAQQAELSAAIVRHGESSAEVEAIRADHAREALRAKLEEMGVEATSAEAYRAKLALARRLGADRDAADERRVKAGAQIIADLTRQGEVSAAILVHGEDSAEVEAIRNRHAREVLEHRLAEQGLGPALIANALALTEAEQRRVEAIKAAAGAKSATEMLTELREQAAINAAILRHGEDSVQVKELQIAAERRLFEESLKTLRVSEARKEELRREWELTHGLAAVDPFGRVAASRDRDRDHRETIARLQLEMQLLGSTSQARARALAVHDAEVEARRAGLDVGSREMELMKSRAAGIADITTELERHRDAWDKVHQAAEGVIDGPIDALLKGDVKGALASFAQEFLNLHTELAWKNPLKNRLLGTNYATLDDVGGLGGMIGRMFGGRQAEPLALSGAGAMTPASMAVTTPMVNISTSGLSGLPLAAGLGPAANMPFAPTGPSVDAARLQAVAIGGATRADAITGLNGPFAAALSSMIGDAQRLFGDEAVKLVSAFRSIEVQAKLWSDALQKYGSVAEARKWVAPPGSSNHNHGLAADLRYGSPAVQQWFHSQAANYGLGFRLGNEPWHIEPANIQAAKAGQALPVAQLERLAMTAEMATGQLTTFGTRAETTGQGLAAMGGTFAQALQMFGASKGPGGMLAATLLGGVFKGIGIPGFEIGGWTGPGAPNKVAGLVHAEEYVFDAPAVRRIGVANLEAIRSGAMRGYQAGGYVTGGRPVMSPTQQAAIAGATAAASTPAEARHVFEINVSGTGDAQIAAGVTAAIEQAFDNFNRNVFTAKVRAVINNEWVA